jgi:hypothetical protein
MGRHVSASGDRAKQPWEGTPPGLPGGSLCGNNGCLTREKRGGHDVAET